MRRTILLAVLTMCLTFKIEAQAILTFEETTFDFGSFKESQKQVHDFVFSNTGDEPLIIQQAYSSCGCTVASYPKESIEPGAKAKLTVTYNGKGKFPGHFKKAVTVISSAANKNARVYIEGTMVADD